MRLAMSTTSDNSDLGRVGGRGGECEQSGTLICQGLAAGRSHPLGECYEVFGSAGP